MNLFDTINGRRSVRSFLDKEVEQEKVEKILNAAINAPSAGNIQPWEFVIVKEKETKEKISEAALGQSFVAEAPVVVVVCADTEKSASRYGERGRDLYCIQDCATATQNLMLAAHALDLGTVWVGAFDENSLKKILNLPENIRPLAIIPVGYPAEKPSGPERTKLEEVVHSETF